MEQILETNAQYYQGAQIFKSAGAATEYKTTFDTNLVFFTSDPILSSNHDLLKNTT